MEEHLSRARLAHQPPARCEFGKPPIVGPGHDKNWPERLGRELAGLAERLGKGDSSALSRLRRAAPTTTAGQALEPSLGDCADNFPYLASVDGANIPLYDRMLWWTTDGTATGASVTAPPTGFIDKQFECEFNRPLVTIVGGNPATDPLPSGFDVRSWDGFNAPNEVPGLQFTVRVQQPLEDTHLEIATVRAKTSRDNRIVDRRVIRNGGVPVTPPDRFAPGTFRSSLLFEFYVPQRAVGVEFGYRPLPQGDRQLSAVGVMLYAYDDQGRVITSSDAGRVGHPNRQGDDPLLRLDSVQHRVGVRDANGNIRAVELRFESVHAHDPNGVRIVEEQLVYRVWHESLPPAVVIQDRISRSYGPGAGEPTIQSLTLPYHCDRAVVLMRGFKLEFLDGQSRDFGSIPAFLETPDGYPPIYQGGNEIRFVARGDPSADDRVPRRVTVYYTVLAWDSAQIDLFASQLGAENPSGNSEIHSTVGFEAFVPLTRFFGGLQGFSFDFGSGRQQALDRLWLAVGRFWGGPCFFGTGIDTQRGLGRWGQDFSGSDNALVIVYNPPGLAGLPGPDPGSLQIKWDICSQLHGDDHDAHTRTVKGAILGGGSLDIPDYDTLTDLPFQPPGPRPDPNVFLRIPPFAVGGGPTGADMVIVALESFFLNPHNPAQQLEVEVRAHVYDGTSLQWGVGGGLNNNDGALFAMPAFATLKRKSRFQTGDPGIQDLFFDGVVGLASESAWPDAGVGAIRNIGAQVVKLSSMRIDDDGGRFQFRFLWRNNLVDANGLLPLFPLALGPGDVFWIGGRYLPNAVAGDRTVNPPVPPDRGRITFVTDSPTQPTVAVVAWGVARAAQPAGAWLIPSLDFADTEPGQPKSLVNVLQSTGPTPLVINSLSLEQPNTGFTFRLASEPLDGLTVIVTYTETRAFPEVLDTVTNRLLADTNAGVKPLPLVAGGIRRNATGIGG